MSHPTDDHVKVLRVFAQAGPMSFEDAALRLNPKPDLVHCQNRQGAAWLSRHRALVTAAIGAAQVGELADEQDGTWRLNAHGRRVVDSTAITTSCETCSRALTAVDVADQEILCVRCRNTEEVGWRA